MEGFTSHPTFVAPQIAIHRKPGVAKRRTVYRTPLAPMKRCVMHDNSLDNAIRAVSERVFFISQRGEFVPPPAGNARVAWNRLRRIHGKLTGMLGKGTPISDDQFVGLYSGRRRTIYQSAVDSLKGDPLKDVDSRVKAFVKAEKTILTREKPDPAPRLIQPRHPRYNVEVGKFLKPLESRLYHIIDRVMGKGGKTVMKGLNALERAKSIVRAFGEIQDPVWIGVDASRFDQHVRRFMLKWEHSIYLSHYEPQDRKKLAKLLKRQLRNIGRIYLAEGTIKYTTDGGRASGDMNTSLGNVLIMCCLIWTYMQQFHIDFRIIDDGDDAGIIVSRKHWREVSDGIIPWFLDMGFTMKVEPPVFEIPSIEFCNTKPVLAAGRWVMTRLVPNCIVKDTHSLLPLNNSKAVKNFYKSIGDCGLALASGVPILQELYRLYIRSAGNAKGFGLHTGLESGMLQMAIGMKVVAAPVSTEARYSFYVAFGYTPDEQVSYENYLRSIDALPTSFMPGLQDSHDFCNMSHWLHV